MIVLNIPTRLQTSQRVFYTEGVAPPPRRPHPGSARRARMAFESAFRARPERTVSPGASCACAAPAEAGAGGASGDRRREEDRRKGAVEPAYICLRMAMRWVSHFLRSGFIEPPVMPARRSSCFLISSAGLPFHFSMNSFSLSEQPSVSSRRHLAERFSSVNFLSESKSRPPLYAAPSGFSAL